MSLGLASGFDKMIISLERILPPRPNKPAAISHVAGCVKLGPLAHWNLCYVHIQDSGRSNPGVLTRYVYPLNNQGDPIVYRDSIATNFMGKATKYDYNNKLIVRGEVCTYIEVMSPYRHP
jgi:hypothetical protein